MAVRIIQFMLLFLLVFLPAYSQDSEKIESLLNENEINCGQAAWFTLATVLNEAPDGEQEAFKLACEKGWLPVKTEIKDLITMKKLSLLVMKAFEIKGGMMYRCTKNARYAYRDLKDMGILPSNTYSNLKVSGEQFLYILSNASPDNGGAQ